MFKSINNFIKIICSTLKTFKRKDILKVIFISIFTGVIITLLETYEDTINIAFIANLILAIKIIDIFVKNAIFNVFTAHLEHKKNISLKYFYSNMSKNIPNYIIIVSVSYVTASFIVIWLNFILSRCGMSNSVILDEFISIMIIHWLLFHGYISLAKKDSINQEKNTHNWMMFAMIRFILMFVLPNIYIINSILNIIFMLFSLICVYENKKRKNKKHKRRKKYKRSKKHKKN